MAHGSLDWLTARPIAHRGLHDGNVAIPENSLPAARAAIEKNFAIECDVMLSVDKVPMVFHDSTLDRLTAEQGPVGERTAEALGRLTLAGTKARIPTVAAFLEAVGGRVPIVMELKGSSAETDEGFLGHLLPVLAAYDGPLALMSFDEWLIEQALAAGTYPVGLTAEGLRDPALSAHRDIVESGCAFVSYNVHHLPNPFTDWVRTERHAPVITWTVRTPDEVAQTFAHADQMTFEGFVPQP